LLVDLFEVVAFNGSARKDGNTAILLRRVLAVLEAEGLETELINLRAADPRLYGMWHLQKNPEQRMQNRQRLGKCLIAKMVEADGILLVRRLTSQ